MQRILTRIGPTWRFAIVASLVVVAAGYLLVTVLTNAIVDANLHSAEAEARDTVARRVLFVLKPEDMSAPLQGERLAELDRFVRESVVSARTARIKIWAPDGRVIYADDPAIIGRQFPPDDELQQALLGVTSSDRLSALGAENQSEANRGTLLEIYTPLIFPGTTQPAGAFEIYQIYEPVAQQVAIMRRYVLLTLGGGLGAFYLALLVMAQGVGVIRRQGHRLAVSEREFEDLVHSVEAIVWEANPATVQFTFVSEQAERLLGYPTEDWVKTPGFWVDHMHPDDRDGTSEACATATAEMRDHYLEFRMIAVDGRTVWFRDLVRVEGNDGIPTRLRGVMFDITERKEAEIAVSRLGAIVQSSDDMVVGIDLEGAIVTWNTAAEEFTDQKAADVMGRQLKEILPGHGQAVEEALGRTRRGEPVESFETEIPLPGGNELALSVSVFAIRSAQGQTVGLASIIRKRDHAEANGTPARLSGRPRLSDWAP
ncbi:MAG: PAS domain S-box protein [Tepidiformaceae bacterium]